MKRKAVVIGVMLGLVVGVTGFWFLRRGAFERRGFRMDRLFTRTRPPVLELHGNVEVRVVRLGFDVPGRLARLAIDEGDRVAPGQVVAELETAAYEDAVRHAEATVAARRAELNRLLHGSRPDEIRRARAQADAARAAFHNAEMRYRRAQELYQAGVITQQELDDARAVRDEAEARLKAAAAFQRLVEQGPRKEDIERARSLLAQARAQLIDARRRLKETRLISPVAGVIQTRVHEVGDYIPVGEPVVIISLDRPVWVRVYAHAADLEFIRPGMKATVITDTGKTFPGRVGYISPNAEFTPKTVETREVRTDLVYRIRVIVPDDRGILRQGMPVTVRFDMTEGVHGTKGPGDDRS